MWSLCLHLNWALFLQAASPTETNPSSLLLQQFTCPLEKKNQSRAPAFAPPAHEGGLGEFPLLEGGYHSPPLQQVSPWHGTCGLQLLISHCVVIFR